MKLFNTLKDYSVLVLLTLSLYLGLMSLMAIDKINDRIDRQLVEYQFVVTDSMMTVFNGENVVGTVRVQGQLDSLLVDYNQ